MSEEVELNDGHITEAVDRISVASEYVDQFLGNHPLIDSCSEFKGAVDDITSQLNKLYSRVGEFDSVAEIKRTLTVDRSVVVRGL